MCSVVTSRLAHEMTPLNLFSPGLYDNPLTTSGRGRTIAAFLIAQGNVTSLSGAEMRRDILNSLMSTRAVCYWLNDQGWLETTRKVGRVQLMRLTDSGHIICQNSLAGGGSVPTEPTLVQFWVNRMLQGGGGSTRKTFAPLREI